MAAMETEKKFPSLSDWDCIYWMLSSPLRLFYLHPFGYSVKYLNIRRRERECVHTCEHLSHIKTLSFEVFFLTTL